MITGNEGFWLTEIFGLPLVFYFMTVYGIATILSIKKLMLRSIAHMKQKGKNMVDSFLVLIPYSSFLILTVIWFLVSQHMSDFEMRMFFNVVGFIFTYLTSRLIVQRICKEPTVLFYPVLIPFFLVVCNDVLFFFG